ncbi:hypothetical protein Tco_0370842 [Tanacetum coccineum]
MTTLQFADTHNLVVFLAKPAKSEGFEQVATVKVKTINREQQLQALVDGKKIVVTEASVRRDLQLDDEEGTDCLPNATIFEELTKMGRPKEKDTQVPQSSVPSDPINVTDEAVNEEPSMQLKELMDFYTKLQQRVLDLENTKNAQAQEITSLKMRVKKLEKKGGSRTHKLRRLYKVGRSARVVSSDEASLGDQEDASKQGRKIDDINADAGITLDSTHFGTDTDMFGVHDLDGDEVVVESEVFAKKKHDEVNVAEEVVSAAEETINAATITEDGITLAQALAKLKSVKPKVTTATTTTTKGILLQEPSESITTTTTTTTIPSKDKGKGIMVKEPLKMKKKDQINFDEQEAIRLQAEFDEEARLTREKDEANVALIEEWNYIQANIDVDYQMAKQMQAEEQKELSIEEKSKLFVQLLEARKKHFAAKRAEEKRNMPPTRAQQRSIMVNTFVYMDTDLVEGSNVRAESSETKKESISKRAGDELEQEKAKKQKVDGDKETIELQSLMKVIPDEEEVAVDAIPLATKPPSIVN